jgi:NAD(P)H dehydrogenase (quinone)
MFVIAGVTGHTGAVVADTLLTRGQPVRVLVRDPARGEPWRARGAEVAIATYEDTAALTRALRGAAGAYLVLPPRFTDPDPLAANRAATASIARAAADAALPHAVLLSSFGAQHEAGTGPIRAVHAAERDLAGAVPATTAVRAAFFLENWGHSLGLLDQGVLPTFTPVDVAFPMVATADIGRTAAAALIEGGHGHRIVELSGPRTYSPADIAAAIAAITGRPVRAEQAPLDAVVPTLTGMGASPALAGLYREMYQGIAAGLVVPEGGAGRAVHGTVTAEDVVRGLLAG